MLCPPNKQPFRFLCIVEKHSASERHPENAVSPPLQRPCATLCCARYPHRESYCLTAAEPNLRDYPLPQVCRLLMETPRPVGDSTTTTTTTATTSAAAGGDTFVCPDVAAAEGTTPLQWACWGAHLSTCKLLFERGADHRSVNAYGCNVAHWCGLSGDVEVCRCVRACVCVCVCVCGCGCFGETWFGSCDVWCFFLPPRAACFCLWRGTI